MTQFNALLLETLPALRAYAMQLTRNRANADDLVQDATVKLISRADTFEPGTNFKAWAFTVLRHAHIDNVRSRARKSEHIDGDEIDVPVPASQEDALVLKQLLQSMSQLAGEQRDVLQLVVGQGLSYEETARVLECPVGTVRSRLSRGRRELERLMTGESAGQRTPIPGSHRQPQRLAA
jgi:RNA polymerase sigma-70 factor (ECF subfamily)